MHAVGGRTVDHHARAHGESHQAPDSRPPVPGNLTRTLGSPANQPDAVDLHHAPGVAGFDPQRHQLTVQGYVDAVRVETAGPVVFGAYGLPTITAMVGGCLCDCAG